MFIDFLLLSKHNEFDDTLSLSLALSTASWFSIFSLLFFVAWTNKNHSFTMVQIIEEKQEKKHIMMWWVVVRRWLCISFEIAILYNIGIVTHKTTGKLWRKKAAPEPPPPLWKNVYILMWIKLNQCQWFDVWIAAAFDSSMKKSR